MADEIIRQKAARKAERVCAVAPGSINCNNLRAIAGLPPFGEQETQEMMPPTEMVPYAPADLPAQASPYNAPPSADPGTQYRDQQTYSFEDACRMAGQTTGACAPKSEQQEDLDCKQIAYDAFHEEKLREKSCGVKLSPVLDAEIFVEMIGLPNVAKINDLKLTIGRSIGLNDAVSSFYKGLPIIILDPQWAKSGTAESYLVLAHEAGHHFCGHPGRLDDPIARKKQELEADTFSGAAMRRFEEYHGRPFFQDALQAAGRLYAGPKRSGYPAPEARLEAIKLGYNSGSPCGNLSAGVRGYTAGPR